MSHSLGDQRFALAADVLEGYDFAITASDARDYAADKMLQALEFVRMTFADIERQNARAINALG